MHWIAPFFGVLFGLGLLIVGLLVVRPRSPRSGLLLVGAGALQVLGTCCERGTDLAGESIPPIATIVLDHASDLRSLATAALVALALALLGRDAPPK